MLHSFLRKIENAIGLQVSLHCATKLINHWEHASNSKGNKPKTCTGSFATNACSLSDSEKATCLLSASCLSEVGSTNEPGNRTNKWPRPIVTDGASQLGVASCLCGIWAPFLARCKATHAAQQMTLMLMLMGGDRLNP